MSFLFPKTCISACLENGWVPNGEQAGSNHMLLVLPFFCQKCGVCVVCALGQTMHSFLIPDFYLP